MRLNDATPAEWDRLRKEIPAIEKVPKIDKAMKAYVDMADEELEDVVNKPKHYNKGEIECIDGISAMLSHEEFVGYLRGNSLKYRWRYPYKNGTEDLRKAAWYEDKLLKVLDKNG